MIGVRIDPAKVLLIINSNAAVRAVSEGAADYYITARGLTAHKLYFDMGTSIDRRDVRVLSTPVTGDSVGYGTTGYINTAWTCTGVGTFGGAGTQLGQGFLTAIGGYVSANAIDAVILSAATPLMVWAANLTEIASGAGYVLANQAALTASHVMHSTPQYGYKHNATAQALGLGVRYLAAPARDAASRTLIPRAAPVTIDGGTAYVLPPLADYVGSWAPARERIPCGRLGFPRNPSFTTSLATETLAEVQSIVTRALAAEAQDNRGKPVAVKTAAAYGTVTLGEINATLWELALCGVKPARFGATLPYATPNNTLVYTASGPREVVDPSQPPLFGFCSHGAPSGTAGESSPIGIGPVTSTDPGAWCWPYGSGTCETTGSMFHNGKGVAGTWNAEEPVADGLPNYADGVSYLLRGHSFAEAYFWSQWQGSYGCCVGDPLYAPYKQSPAAVIDLR